MFNNLEAELKRKQVTREELAKHLGSSISTVSTKLNGKYDFTLPEAISIKKYLGVDADIEYLFEAGDKDKPQAMGM